MKSIRTFFARFMRIGAPLVTLITILLLPSAGNSQVLYGTLIGRVEDHAGAVVTGAKVSVTNKATGQERDATTDSDGSFAFRDLQVGVYDLKVTQSGFKAYLKAARKRPTE